VIAAGRRQRIFHPLLFAAFIVLFAYAHSFEIAPPLRVVLALLGVVVAAVALLWAIFAGLTRNLHKAAIAASAFVLLFVSYGHIENAVTAWSWEFHLFAIQFGYKKAAAGVCAALGAGVTAWLVHADDDKTRRATAVLNRAGAAIVSVSALHLVLIGLAAGKTAEATLTARSVEATGTHTGPLPDIYYIVLDTYGRSDLLKAVYGYDNSAFVEWLRAKGFYVASDSHSNYSQTMLSLASSTNLAYLDAAELKNATSAAGDPRWHVDLNATAVQLLNAAHENDRLPLAHLIQRNLLARTLKERGYRFVAFTSGYGGVQFPNADDDRRAAVLTDFEESLLSTTPIPELADRVFDRQERHRQRVRYVLDHLGDTITGDAPRFVFAHILSPHSPYVFNADGSAVDRTGIKPGVFYDEEMELSTPADRARVIAGYRGQVEYVTRRIQSVIEAILADPTRRRIIVLQGDHGPNVGMRWKKPASAEAIAERLSILNAYYVPPDIQARLYPSITPVNTFRVILGQLLGQNWSLLPDKTYFSPDDPYEFNDVTEMFSHHDAF